MHWFSLFPRELFFSCMQFSRFLGITFDRLPCFIHSSSQESPSNGRWTPTGLLNESGIARLCTINTSVTTFSNITLVIVCLVISRVSSTQWFPFNTCVLYHWPPTFIHLSALRRWVCHFIEGGFLYLELFGRYCLAAVD